MEYLQYETSDCERIDKSLFIFDGKNWTGNIVERSDDDQILIKSFCQPYFMSWFQLTVIKNSQKERWKDIINIFMFRQV